MARSLRKKIRFFAFSAIAWVLLFALGASSSEASANGILRSVGNQQILNLWGTNYEMGYAHGYLLADKIRDLVDHYMIGTVAGGNVSIYNALLARDASEFQWQQQYLDEIKGMADGMAASGKTLYIPSLGRVIDSRDIRAFNLQEEFFFCSSFGVWGKSTANNETVIARNMDFYYDSQGNNANYQIVIAYEPTSKSKFVSFAWPGFVGVYSGMNENGATVMANTGNITNPYGGPYHPVVDVYRTILETTNSSNFFTQPLAVISSVHEDPSEIIQIATPYQGNGYPAYYIEQSPDIDLIRYPADYGYDHIIATNHFLNVIAPPSSGESVNRYNTIRDSLISLYGRGDGKMDSTEAFNILGSVANIVAPTLTSIVVRPNRMEFDLSFAKMQNGVFTSAANVQPQTYTWASLFPDHQLVAVNDAYTTAANVTIDQAAPGVLGNDTGPGGGTLTAQLVGGPDHGTLTLNDNGSFVYTPVANYAGSDSFTYTANDGTSSSNVATVTVTVMPAGAISSLSVGPTSVTGGSTSQGTVILSSPAPSGGVVVLLSDNSSAASEPSSVTVPAGSTSATFTITTNPVTSVTQVTISAVYGGVTKSATLTLTVSASGLAIDATSSADSGGLSVSTIAVPAFTTKAGNDLLLAFISASYIGAAPNVNVTGVSGGGLTWTLVRRTNTQQGASEIWQAFATEPLTNVTVTANLSTSGAAASINVVAFAGVNVTNPVGAVGGGSAASGAPTASLITQGTNSWVFGVGNDWDGAVARTVGASQTMVHQYLSPTGDTFWVQRQNATVLPAGTVVTINDTAPTNHQWNLSIVEIRALTNNLSPVAVNDIYSTNANTALNQAAPGVLNNDTDPQGKTLTAQLVSGSSHGTLTLNTNGSFAYAPAASYVGTDSFTYSANNGTSSSNIATVTITVAPALTLSSLSISPTSVTGGATSRGTVKLSGPAPIGGVVVSLSDNSSAASVPASITVARGSTSATFTITTYPVTSSRSVTVSASYGGVTKAAALTVRRR